MPADRKGAETDPLDLILAEARRRAQTYRARALKLLPWVCARCEREFSGKKLRELTVHHKDHNHDHNPQDGSNWVLLCLYCHDNEHTRSLDSQWHQDATPGDAIGDPEGGRQRGGSRWGRRG